MAKPKTETPSVPTAPTAATEKVKRQVVSQSTFPTIGLFNALRIAKAIWDELAGDGGRPIEVAAVMKMQPSGGAWKNLCGAAIAFGLTDGGYNATKIKLLPLGRRCVAPEEEGDDRAAMIEAFLKPTLISSFLLRYDGKKFPSPQIGANVLNGLGFPKDRASAAYDLLLADAVKLGIIQEIRGEKYVNLNARASAATKPTVDDILQDESESEIAIDCQEPLAETVAPLPPPTLDPLETRRVFITHGKDKGIRDQIEEIVKYGGFEPVISVKTESLAKPVPLKVLDEMRSCGAAVIHVGIEQRVVDSSGNEVDLVNQNVLIEVGAAMALYREKFILLVEEGVVLPSNLQGLYECRYSGSELSMTATMKLLKAFNDFKSK